MMSKMIGILPLVLLLSACVSTDVENIDTLKKDAANINVQLAVAYIKNGNMPLAKQKILLALQQNPKLPAAWYTMAYYLERVGSVSNANEYYLQAIKLAPNEGAPRNNYGVFLCKHGQYQAAIAQLLIAAKNINYLNTAQAYANAGKCALKIPNKALAEVYFQQARLQASK